MGRSALLWSAGLPSLRTAVAVAVLMLRTVASLPQNANSKSLGSGGSGQTSNNIDFTEERDAEDLRYKQVIQAWEQSILSLQPVICSLSH